MDEPSPVDVIESIDQLVPLEPAIKTELLQLVSTTSRTPEQSERLEQLLKLLELEASAEYGKTVVNQELDRQSDERLEALEQQMSGSTRRVEEFMEAFIEEDRNAAEKEAVDEARQSIENS